MCRIIEMATASGNLIWNTFKMMNMMYYCRQTCHLLLQKISAQFNLKLYSATFIVIVRGNKYKYSWYDLHAIVTGSL